ncbi:MAG TPA: hypothetical protein VMS76_16880 [Planctomycetota bacterium]|nr:hypothetical protein [Planctomycetota bacterium]
MRDRLSHAPRFDFEALLRSFDRYGHRSSPSPAELERRWAAVRRYAGAFEHDDGNDRRGAPSSSGIGRLAGSLLGVHGWGYDGSTGAAHGPGELQCFEGIQDGLRKL